MPSGLNDFVAHRVHDKFGDGMQVQLEHDICPVCFSGVHADSEKRGDFLVTLSFGQKLQNFPFTRREARPCRLCGIAAPLGELFRSDHA